MPVTRRLVLLLAPCALIFAFLTTPPLLLAEGKERVLYAFTGGADGASPSATLIFDAAGNLYGETPKGGAYGCGTVFEVVRERDETWSETVLYSFACGRDGYLPLSGLVFDPAGSLYGTTVLGGATRYICYEVYGVASCGTVFRLTRHNGGWVKKTLHTFCATSQTCVDGAFPFGPLVLDKAGNVYGTTAFGGINDKRSVETGVVFKLAAKNGKWTEELLHRFNPNRSDAGWSIAPLIFDQAGRLYGTAEFGGAAEHGSVFELVPGRNSKWTEELLLSFDLENGGCPNDGLIFDAAGNLYGTSGGTFGGGCTEGNVFQLTPSANGTWRQVVLHTFGANEDGLYPSAGLIFDAAGNLYGTTPYGGGKGNGCDGGCGTVFKLMPNGNGGWTEEVLHRFPDNATDGTVPFGGLVSDAAGKLYGTTYIGGKYNAGTVFEITP